MKKIKLLFLSFFIFTNPLVSFSNENPPYNPDLLPKPIAKILSMEHNISTAKMIVELMTRLDETYVNLYDKLQNGGKIIIFIDPAHGKLPNGFWEGEATGRMSCTGLPEEYYSIILSRELYKLLSNNKFIEVKSTDDFLSVLKGKSDVYYNIPFTKTVRMANENNAFLLMSEHLNNIGSLVKASGIMNIPGIHIINDRWGNRYLSFIKDTYKGFLTLYNKFDTTEFSKKYSENIKDILSSNGMIANSWDLGSVADDRFCYFVDFPISVIYESGFISNPEEEAFLRDPKNQKMIAQSQYDSLIKTINEIFGIDISGRGAKIANNSREEMFNLLKLSRIAIFYINNCETEKAVATINIMESNYGANQSFLAPYRQIKRTLITAGSYYKTSRQLIAQKKYKNARWYAYKAKKVLRYKPIFSALFSKYSGDYSRLGVHVNEDYVPNYVPISYKIATLPPAKIKRSSLSTPIILPVDIDQTLEDAIIKALNPNKETLEKLMKSFNSAYSNSRIKVRGFSKTDGKPIRYWKNVKEKVYFDRGIYIITLNGNLSVSHIRQINKVVLNPWKFQNQQFLKNSYFSFEDKEKSL
jgi:N-acetylmuramoyl-L-alanine amidase